jgi:hypothetical protein
MNHRGPAALYQALTGPPGSHLDDETLALLAHAEAVDPGWAGVEQLDSAAFAHLETCLACAERYGNLVEMMLDAVADLAAAPAVISPAEVYTSLLLDDLTPVATGVATGADLAQLAPAVAGVVASLPLFFTTLPAEPADIPPDLIETIVRQSSPTAAPIETEVAALADAIRQNVATLALYLLGQASAVWQRTVTVAGSSVQDQWHQLQLALAPARVVPVLSGEEIGEERLVLSRRIAAAVPFQVAMKASRLTPLSCQLAIQVDRPGLKDPSGRPVQIAYGDQRRTTTTNRMGTAHFEAVPVAALADFTIRVQER